MLLKARLSADFGKCENPSEATWMTEPHEFSSEVQKEATVTWRVKVLQGVTP